MKKITFTFLFLICSFVYSQETDSLKKLKNTNNMQSEAKEIACNCNFGYYIAILTLLVAIVPASSFFHNNNLVKKAEQELLSLKLERENLVKEKINLFKIWESEFEDLKEKKNSIINSIKDEGEKLFKEYFVEFKIQYTIEEINTLLSQNKPNGNEVYSKLSSIIEKIDLNNAYIVNKCMKVFPKDKNIERLQKIVFSNISKEP